MKPINVTKSSLPSFHKYKKLIRSVWKTNQLTNFGPLHNLLEDNLKSYLGVENIYLVSNGHLALEIALEALELKGEIITTPFTFVSTTNAIIRSGLVPVFCDINIENYTIDAKKIEPLINENTSAILAVHVYGNICDIDEISKLAKKYNLKVIYDAAHSFGITYNQKSIMTYGDISITSFHAAKIYNTGEGGAIFVNNENLNMKLYELINFGIVKNGGINYPGLNAKMSEFGAALGLLNLETVDLEIANRKRVANSYDRYLSELDGINITSFQRDTNYSYYTILIENNKFPRDTLLDELKKNNIMARKYFWPLTSDLDYCSEYRKDSLENSKLVSNSVVALPMYGGLSTKDIKRICNIIKIFVERNKS